jgi:hypothetical protein
VSCVCAFAAEAKNSLSATEREMDGDLINSHYNRGARGFPCVFVCFVISLAFYARSLQQLVRMGVAGAPLRSAKRVRVRF